MPEFTIDNINYVLKKEHNFSWLNKYGKVFRIFDQNDSRNISFGVDNGEKNNCINRHL